MYDEYCDKHTKLMQEYSNLKKENEILNKGIEYAKRIEKDYKTRFNKAIEYINRCKNYHKTYHSEDKMFADELESLIMVLQGNDKNQLITNNTMVNINGKVFHCSCGANVFSEYSNSKYICNGCGNEFYGGNKK